MGLDTMTHSVQRAWSVEIRPQPGGTIARCLQCGPITPIPATTLRRIVLTHLAQHARANVLAAHLRTCQCREHNCRWHVRHRGCDGPILLVLARGAAGRMWRLADTCRACALVMEAGAVVHEVLGPSDQPVSKAVSNGCQEQPGPPSLRCRTEPAAPTLSDAEANEQWWDETWEVWITDHPP